MQQNKDRIQTTHVGSLPRPHDLLDLMKAKIAAGGKAPAGYNASIKKAVTESVHRQAETGIDIVADGEMSKPGFFSYVAERLAGFEARPNEKRISFEAERNAFPEYYEEYFKQAMLGGSIAPTVPMVCTGPIAYRGQAAVARDIANLKTAMTCLLYTSYNTAVEDAVNLGWKLAAVLRSWGGAKLLASYELERLPVARRNTCLLYTSRCV